MKFEITKEMKEKYDAYVEADKAVDASDNYDGRSKERRAKDKAEKALRTVVSEEATIQGQELIKQAGFNLEDLHVRYSYYLNNLADTAAGLKPEMTIDFKPGWYGTENLDKMTQEHFKELLQKNKENEDEEKSTKNKEKALLKETEEKLKAKGVEFESAWDTPYSDEKEGYYKGEIRGKDLGGGSDSVSCDAKINTWCNKLTVDVRIRVEGADVDLAVELFQEAVKRAKEAKQKVIK